MKKRYILLIAGLALAIVAAACGDDEVAVGDLGLVTEGTLTVCTDSPYKPMEFELDGEFTGFDIELMRAIASELGLATAVINSGFDPITSGVAMESGQCDIAAASITITDEREENIDFSDPYFTGDQSLLVKTGSGVTALSDFAGGQRLAVQTGTTGEAYAQENATGAEIVSFDDPGDLFLALEAGDVAGALQDIVVNFGRALDDATIEVVEIYPTDESYGLAVKETGSEDLLKAVNDALAKLKDDGTYDDLFKTWFGVE